MKYKVLKEFVLNGITQQVDTIIELDFMKANLKSIQGNIEKAPDNVNPKDGSVLGNIIPGVPLTPEQKAKLAKENMEVSMDAQRLAAEHRQKDMQEGKGEPAVKAVADLIKDKLQNEQFEKKEELPPTEPAV